MKRKRELRGDTCYIPTKAWEFIISQVTLPSGDLILDDFIEGIERHSSADQCLAIEWMEREEYTSTDGTDVDCGCMGLRCSSCAFYGPEWDHAERGIGLSTWRGILSRPRIEMYEEEEDASK